MKSSKLPITAVVLAHQLNDRLRQAIDSLSWASQIIVIWESTNNLNVVVDDPVWKKVELILLKTQKLDFGALRNIGLKKAHYEWVFFLDSDEVFASDFQSLKMLINQPDLAGIQLKRQDFFLGKKMKWGEVRDVWITRLVRKNQTTFSRAVHEVAEVKGKISRSSLLILHYSHFSLTHFLDKISQYIEIEAQLRYTQGERFAWPQLIFKPIGKFFWNYVAQLGFLDGWRGLILAIVMSIHSFSVRARLYELS